MTFNQWFSDIGQRCRNFDARTWAEAGWNAHRMHGDNCMIESDPIPEEMKLLEAGDES